jgi:hypothetical protein
VLREKLWSSSPPLWTCSSLDFEGGSNSLDVIVTSLCKYVDTVFIVDLVLTLTIYPPAFIPATVIACSLFPTNILFSSSKKLCSTSNPLQNLNFDPSAFVG